MIEIKDVRDICPAKEVMELIKEKAAKEEKAKIIAFLEERKLEYSALMIETEYRG